MLRVRVECVADVYVVLRMNIEELKCRLKGQKPSCAERRCVRHRAHCAARRSHPCCARCPPRRPAARRRAGGRAMPLLQ